MCGGTHICTWVWLVICVRGNIWGQECITRATVSYSGNFDHAQVTGFRVHKKHNGIPILYSYVNYGTVRRTTRMNKRISGHTRAAASSPCVYSSLACNCKQATILWRNDFCLMCSAFANLQHLFYTQQTTQTDFKVSSVIVIYMHASMQHSSPLYLRYRSICTLAVPAFNHCARNYYSEIIL